MCFSAPASFIASGSLVAIGGASLAAAKKEDKLLALVPLFFGIQQFTEGIQWLFINAGTSSLWAGYGFLFFAFIVWPIYVPTFVYILDKKRRPLLKWFIALGSVIGICSLAILITQSLAIHKVNACIGYDISIPHHYLGDFTYLVVIFGSLFCSSIKTFRWIGALAFILAVVAWLFFTLTFTSVWCFFAAVISALFLVYIKEKKI